MVKEKQNVIIKIIIFIIIKITGILYKCAHACAHAKAHQNKRGAANHSYKYYSLTETSACR